MRPWLQPPASFLAPLPLKLCTRYSEVPVSEQATLFHFPIGLLFGKCFPLPVSALRAFPDYSADELPYMPLGTLAEFPIVSVLTAVFISLY